MSIHALDLIREASNTNATYLNLGECGLTDDTIPEELFDLTTLETLVLSNSAEGTNDGLNNHLTRLPERINKLKNLKRLYVSDVGLEEITDLSGLTKLIELDCSNNRLKDLSTLKDLTQLATLNCSLNKDSGPLPLSKIPNLISLWCDSNQIEDNSILMMSDLIEIIIYGEGKRFNGLTIQKCPHLIDIYIYDSAFNSLTIQDLPGLTDLYMKRSVVFNLLLKNLPNLYNLDPISSSENDKRINGVTIENCPNLIEIYLTDIAINTLAIQDLSNLADIRMIGAHIYNFILKNLPEAKKLDLSSADYAYFENLSLSNLPNLQSLNCVRFGDDDNRFPSPAIVISGVPNLKKFDCDYDKNTSDFSSIMDIPGLLFNGHPIKDLQTKNKRTTKK